MNRIYRVVFNQALDSWQAVSEIARGRVRSSSPAADRPSMARPAPNAGGLRAVATAAMLCLLGGTATAGAGGAGGQPTETIIHAGAGGSDSTGGAGAVNDTDFGSFGGNGGTATPAGATAGSAAFPGAPIVVGPAGAGGAAGIPGTPNGSPGGSEIVGGFGGGGGAGAAGASGVVTANVGLLTGGNGGAGGAGFYAAGGGGGGGYGVVLDPSVTTFTNSGTITAGTGGAGGNASSQGAGGGGGGTGVYFAPAVGTSLIVNSAAGLIQGGSGGNGGNGIGAGGTGPSGGGGGGGGNGVTLLGGQLRNEAGATIAGGNGGVGGAGDATQGGGASGGGGSGGNAININAGGTQVFNAGTLTGGNGGAGGVNTTGPTGAVGSAAVGVGVVGDANTVINAGSISGGLGGDGVTRGNAVTFLGNNNTLELQTGYAFTGNAVATGAGNALALGGTTNGAFDVAGIGTLYQGFDAYRKTGASTWTLSGSNAAVTPWTVQAGTLAIASDASLGAIAGALTLDGGALQTTASIATTRQVILGAAGGTLQTDAGTTLSLSSGITGAGSLRKDGTGVLALSGVNVYTGATTVAAGTLQAGAANTFAAASAHTVAAGATLDLAGFNQSLAALNNGGTVSLLGSTPGTTLTVTGPYVGNNGTLRIGTALGNSASATDRLVLSGATAVASGSTTVQVVNIGGLGAQTTGNGIEVISTANGGSIGANAFSLAGGHVDAGAYEYRLNTTSSGGYLSSTTSVVPTPTDPTTPTTPGVPGVPAAPVGTVPTYRAEVPLFAALPEQLRQGNVAMLGNMHQRTGDDAGERQAWARVISTDRNIRQTGTVSPESDGRLTGLQAGTDLWANAGWRAGVYVGQLEGDMKVSGFARGIQNLAVGSNDLRSQYLGAYASYKNAGGFYADAVLQAGRHRYTVQPSLALRTGGKGDSLLASIEVGQSFPLAPNWTIEPQLQLVHQRLSLDDASIFGAQVQQDTDSGWLVRAGVRVKGEIATGVGTLQPYGRFNIYSSSKGNDVTRFIGPAAYTDILTRTGGTSSELAAGATLVLSPTTSLYGELGKLWASGGNARVKSSVNASLGVKVRW